MLLLLPLHQEWLHSNIIIMLIYTVFDWTFTIVSAFLLIYLPIQYEPAYFLIGIASYLFYPLVLELICNVLSWITYSEQHPRI